MSSSARERTKYSNAAPLASSVYIEVRDVEHRGDMIAI